MEPAKSTEVPEERAAAEATAIGNVTETGAAEAVADKLNVDVLDKNRNESKEEDLELGDTSNFSTEKRNDLFQRGLEYEKNNKLNAALECYLGCIKGLKNKSLFVLLPQCLHNIADIYREQGNLPDEQAIHFAQAEKLFYETSLIQTEEIQQKIEEIAGEERDSSLRDLNELNIDALRAEEYEHLAKLCLDKNQQQLALEYAGKCTKLRQQVYGNDHEKTKESLNLFAALYSEVGRLQYSDSINLLSQKADNADNENEAAIDDSTPPEIIMSNPAGGEPVSILRQRSEDGSKESERKKKVHFHESVEETIRQKEKEELASLTVTLTLLAVCVLILASMGMWLYCSLDKSHSCQSFMSQIQQWTRTVQYYYHTLTASRQAT